MVDVVACVVNWSTPEDLRKLVESAEIYEPGLRWSIFQNGDSHVDSGPTLEHLFEAYDPRIVLNESETNLGHGAGINHAVRTAHYMWDPDYVFLVNPDCLFTRPILSTLANALEEDPKRFVVGPKQVDSRGKITAGGIIGTMVAPSHRHFHAANTGNVKSMTEDRVRCPMVAGSAMLCRTDEFCELGGLLEAAHYYSETWLCYHANAHGRECWYIGDAEMIHEWHKSSPIGYAETDGRMKEDRELFRRMCDEHVPPIPRD